MLGRLGGVSVFRDWLRVFWGFGFYECGKRGGERGCMLGQSGGLQCQLKPPERLFGNALSLDYFAETGEEEGCTPGQSRGLPVFRNWPRAFSRDRA